MTIMRYNPNRSYLSMQDTMNSLVNALFNTELTGTANENGEYAPRMDMKETEDAYTIKRRITSIFPSATVF